MLTARFSNVMSSNVSAVEEGGTVFFFNTCSKNSLLLLSLRNGHQNKFKSLNPCLHGDSTRKFYCFFFLDLGFFRLSEKECSLRQCPLLWFWIQLNHPIML